MARRFQVKKADVLVEAPTDCVSDEGTLSEGSRKEAVKIEAGKGEEERSRSAGRSHYGFR